MDQDIDRILQFIRDNDIQVPYNRSRGIKYDKITNPTAGSKTPAGCGHTVLLGQNPYRKNTLTRFTQKNPDLYEMFQDFAVKWVSFPVSCFMFNQNYQTQPHYDGMNVGDSAIISFGDYTGGELIVEGEILDAKRKLQVMNGSKQLHWNLPITSGTKYSIIFFRTRKIPR